MQYWLWMQWKHFVFHWSIPPDYIDLLYISSGLPFISILLAINSLLIFQLHAVVRVLREERNTRKILFIMLEMKTIPALQFPWMVQCVSYKLKNYNPVQFFEGHIWLPTYSINRSIPFGAQLQCTNEKMPFLLLIPCVKRSQAALLSFILVQILSGSSEAKALFQVHSDIPLNLFHFGTMTQTISCCCFLWQFAVNVFFKWGEKGGWFSQRGIRKKTAVKGLFLRWAVSQKVHELRHCR